MENKKKKVLIVMTTLYNGGAERSLVNMLKEFPEDRYEVDLLLFKRMGMFLKDVPSFVHVLDTPKGLKRMYGSMRDSGLLLPFRLLGNVLSGIFSKSIDEKRALRWKYCYGPCIEKLDQKYDVAIAYISGEVLYYIDEKVDAVKKLVWIHNDYRAANYPKDLDYPYLKRVDGIVSISERCVEILKEEFPEFQEKMYLLQNITSKKVLLEQADRGKPLEYKGVTNRILSVGRLHEQKGFDLAISAASILKKSGVSFSWFVLGTGALRERLQEQIIRENVEDCFFLLGAKDNPYLYMKHCTMFVQPSRYEGKSVVLDEAKILGIPIIATRYPTVADQLVDGVEGMVVDMSPKAVAEGVLRLLSSTEDRKRFCQYLSQHKYDNSEEIEKYIALIEA